MNNYPLTAIIICTLLVALAWVALYRIVRAEGRIKALLREIKAQVERFLAAEQRAQRTDLAKSADASLRQRHEGKGA